MKTKTYKLEALILFIFLSGAMFGQLTQSKLLNIPIQPGSKYINFRNSTSTTTTAFPINTSAQEYIDFLYWGGFNYNGWEDWAQVVYCGQAPRYASQTITDNDGELIAFIIDNHIYDANGNFLSQLVESYEIFTEPSSSPEDEFSLYHNIIVMPDGDQCSGFYIFAAVGTTDGVNCPGLSIGHFNSKEPDEPYLAKSVTIDTSKGPNLCVNFSMSAVRSETTGDDLLILQNANELTIYNVSDFDFDNNYFPHTVLSLNTDIISEWPIDINRPDMTITSFDDNNYLMATSVIRWYVLPGADIPINSLEFVKIPKDYSTINQNTIEHKYSCFGV